MFTEQELKGKKNADLSSLCKERNLPYSGTKAVLIARLLGLPPPAAATKAKKPTEPAVPRERPCLNLLSKRYIHAVKNTYGNYEDPATRLVFDPTTKYVIGKQNHKHVVKLSMADVSMCREKGLVFVPETFDGNFAPKNEDIETTIERLVALQDNDEESGDEENEEE